MAKKKTDETVEEVKMKLWIEARSPKSGFAMPCFNCVYRVNRTTGDQERLNFRDDQRLRFEVKCRVEDTDTTAWVTVHEAKYTEVSVNKDGSMVFPSSKTEAAK